jgi:hypothetical protein
MFENAVSYQGKIEKNIIKTTVKDHSTSKIFFFLQFRQIDLRHLLLLFISLRCKAGELFLTKKVICPFDIGNNAVKKRMQKTR